MTPVTMVLATALLAFGGAGGFPLASASEPTTYVFTDRTESVIRSPTALFDGAILVPQNSAQDRFAVENASSGVAYLRIALTSVDVPDNALRSALSLSAGTVGEPGPAVPLDTEGSCIPLLAPHRIEAGATVDVDTTLAFANLVGTSGQASQIGFSMLVIMDANKDGVGCELADDDGTSGPGHSSAGSVPALAGTGSDIVVMVSVSSALAAAGIAFRLSRRSQQHPQRRRPRAAERSG